MNKITNTSQKPEFVLKRVNDAINNTGGNAEKEKRQGLEVLHNLICGKKKPGWTIKLIEPLMRRHLELCVELKDHLTAKDGLHNYRNMVQSVDPFSLESVITYLVDLSEDRATAARKRADKVALAAAARVSDLDQEETPESIMLSSMTEEGSKDRTDREVVVPWMVFLWENFRSTLELLYRIPKLEKVYHKTCERAFKFCQDFGRAKEFRRVCEMLRTHLSLLQKAPTTNISRNARPVWEWTSEILESHLQTRFSQLEVATSLELWNEAFRTVEDIYAIIVAGKKSPKPKLMVNYYEKLTRIFWVSDNKLFHAYAWFRYYCLLCDSAKDLKPKDKSILASCVLASALTIPSVRDSHSRGFNMQEEEDVVDEKSQQMAQLLDFPVNPSRQSLLTDIVNKGILKEVIPELQTAYEVLEVKFSPLTLIASVKPCIAALKSIATLNQYAIPLQRITVLKLAQQFSKVYSTLKIEFLYKTVLGELTDLTENQVEKILVEGVTNKQLQLTINHGKGCIQFNAGASTDVSLDNLVAKLATSLDQLSNTMTKNIIAPTMENQHTASRREYLSKIAEFEDEEHANCITRKIIIERRKEGIEKMQSLREEDMMFKIQQDETNRIKAEEQRLKDEADKREADQKRRDEERNAVLRVLKELEKYGVHKEYAEIADLDVPARRSLIVEAHSEAMKAKEEETKKLAEHAKRLDYITRAIRIEESAVILKRYQDQLKQDEKEFEESLAKKMQEDLLQHTEDLKIKTALARMQGYRESFESAILQTQKENHQKKVLEAKRRLILERRNLNISRARTLYSEFIEKLEREAEIERESVAKEEAARIELEQHEALRKQREAKEQADRENEERLEMMKRQIAEKEAENAKKAAEAAAADSSSKTYVARFANSNSSSTDKGPSNFRQNSSLAQPAASKLMVPANDGGGWRSGGGGGDDRNRGGEGRSGYESQSKFSNSSSYRNDRDRNDRDRSERERNDRDRNSYRSGREDQSKPAEQNTEEKNTWRRGNQSDKNREPPNNPPPLPTSKRSMW